MADTEFHLQFERIAVRGAPVCPVVTLARDIPPEGDIASAYVQEEGVLFVMNEPHQVFQRGEWDALIEAIGQLQQEEDKRHAT